MSELDEENNGTESINQSGVEQVLIETAAGNLTYECSGKNRPCLAISRN